MGTVSPWKVYERVIKMVMPMVMPKFYLVQPQPPPTPRRGVDCEYSVISTRKKKKGANVTLIGNLAPV